MCACVCLGASGREKREERECGNNDGVDGGGGRGDKSFAQPSITSLGLGFIWNNSSSLLVVWKHTTHRKPRGGGGGGGESREEGLCLGVGGTEEELIHLEITRG